jgi:CRP/FNR family transcriptional regulator, cyclic AMP receptor protein
MTRNPPPLDRTLQFLKNSTFFGALPDASLDACARKGHTRMYAKGEVICHRGDAGDSMVIILSGRVKIANTTADGREIVVSFLGVGDLAGEIAVLDGQQRTANVVALQDTEVFVIYRRDLMPVLISHPSGMFEVIQILCEKLRVATAIIEDNTREMQARTARGLLRLAQQHGVKSKNGICIDLKISQTDLGNYLGLSRANVSRQLTHLKDAGIVKMDVAKIVVIDEPGLVEVSEQASDIN